MKIINKPTSLIVYKAWKSKYISNKKIRFQELTILRLN